MLLVTDAINTIPPLLTKSEPCSFKIEQNMFILGKPRSETYLPSVAWGVHTCLMVRTRVAARDALMKLYRVEFVSRMVLLSNIAVSRDAPMEPRKEVFVAGMVQ
jgi:hypothetical protein